MEWNCNVLNLLLRFLPNKLIRRKCEMFCYLVSTWLQGVKRSGLACVVLGRLCRRGGSRHLPGLEYVILRPDVCIWHEKLSMLPETVSTAANTIFFNKINTN